MANEVLNGSCLCGAVRYRVRAPFVRFSHCHCSRCRKAHGTAFSTFARIARSRLRLVTGEGELRRFQSGSKAPWHEITDDLPRHEEYPPQA